MKKLIMLSIFLMILIPLAWLFGCIIPPPCFWKTDDDTDDDDTDDDDTDDKKETVIEGFFSGLPIGAAFLGGVIIGFIIGSMKHSNKGEKASTDPWPSWLTRPGGWANDQGWGKNAL
jgi:hypothetical protein